MNKLLIAVLAGALGGTLGSASAADNDKIAYKAMNDRAASDYKAAKAQCKSLKGNAEDICKDEAKVARAHTEADAVQVARSVKGVAEVKSSIQIKK